MSLPPQVMSGYKFKVKLIPGTLKKGKAVRQAADLLLKSGEVSQRERDLIRRVAGWCSRRGVVRHKGMVLWHGVVQCSAS